MLEVKICIGSACHLKGSYNVIQELSHIIEEKSLHDKIDMKAAFCMKQCQNQGVSIEVDNKCFFITPEKTEEFFETIILPKIS